VRFALSLFSVQAPLAKWCKTATTHAPKNLGESWSYLLIPARWIAGNASLDGLCSRFAAS
jgi:hypothetical protein